MKNHHLIPAVRTLLAGVIVLAIAAKPLGATTVLDPNNPGALFQTEGGQSFTQGPGVLTLKDTSAGDFLNFFAFDNDAYAGTTLDVIATFRVTLSIPANVEASNRLVINNGIDHSLIAKCIVVNDGNSIVNGIGLYSSGSPFEPASYPVFVPVEWLNETLTIRLRRWANGDGEIMDINGVAPSPRALLTANLAPAVTRAGASVEFGAASPEAQVTVEYTAFRSELPLAGDFNADAVVDAGDYVVWRKNEGTTNVLPNDPHHGIIGALQYNTWRANFGRTAGPGGGTTSSLNVPEPGTATMTSCGLFLLIAGYARRVRHRVHSACAAQEEL